MGTYHAFFRALAARIPSSAAVFVLTGVLAWAPAQSAENQANSCPDQSAGLKLTPGFCATIFADGIGHARHMVAAPNGVLYVNTWSGSYYDGDIPDTGFLVALQDTKGTGRADVTQRFGETAKSGGRGGTGIALHKGYLYVEINDRIVRYRLTDDSIVPKGRPEVVLSGLPLGGDHPMHPFAIDADGMMYVDVASATNSCQRRNRIAGSPGIKPCVELQTRGGIWRYDASKLNQKFTPGERFATGIRNADGIAIDPSGHGVYSTQHGRDQLSQNWPALYKPEQGATLPAEEMMQVLQGGDYGWPECYYDSQQRKLVLAPEYGGDGGKTVGVCADKKGPVAAFPAHWAPDDLLIYSGKTFPARYHDGAFIAFHGSWNRAPFPQGGYNVVFQPLSHGQANGTCEIFADGFAGANKEPSGAAHRPTGVAVGPDGALFVSDDAHGRVYRIAYSGSADAAATAKFTPCPNDSASAAETTATNVSPPEGSHPEAGALANLPTPPGTTPAMVALGSQIYRGQVASAPCTGCHGSEAKGSPLGPDLAAGHWVWSDGSLDGIRTTIRNGVPKPKQYDQPMPPMGGAQLTPEQLSAVAAYVWAVGHRGSR